MARPRRRSSKPPQVLSVYCDEAGNSGANLTDEAQPLYVIGGWAVPEEYSSEVAAAIKDFKQQVSPNSTELKGSRLLSRPKVQGSMNDFVKSMGQAGAWPIFAVFEKKFWIAGKVVECLLDPEYNTRANWRFFNNLDAKKELANQIYEFPPNVLDAFANTLRTGNFEELGYVIDSLRRVSDLLVMDELSEMLLGASENLVTIHNVEFRDPKRDHSLESVNVPAFVSFLQLLEKMSRNLTFDQVKVIHDQALHFEEGYNWVFETFQGILDDSPSFDSSGTPFLLKFAKITSFETRESDSDDFLQGADILASAVFRYARCAAQKEDIPKWLKESLATTIAGAILPAISDFPASGYLMGSDEFCGRMMAPVWESTSLQNLG